MRRSSPVLPVLVLHNRPRSTPEGVAAESEAGVLDEVRVVVA